MKTQALASSISREHEKVGSDLFMEYNEVSTLHPLTKSKGKYNFQY